MSNRPTTRRGLRRLVAVAAGLAGLMAGAALPAPAEAVDGAWDITQRLRDDAGNVRMIPTSGHSGLVASKKHPNIYYSQVDHPFNGGGARIYAVRLENGVLKPVRPGVLIQEITISGANSGNTDNDWEDITVDRAGQIHIFGHGTSSVFTVDEVDPATSSSTRLTGSYAAPHGGNAETLMWHNGAMYWVDKVTPPTRPNVWKKTMPDGTWQKLGPIPEPPGGFDVGDAERICGGDISDDGTRVAIVTKLNVYVYEGTNPEDALSRPPRWTVDFSSSAMESLTEGLAFVRGSHDIYISNEAGWLKMIPAAVYSPGTSVTSPPSPGTPTSGNVGTDLVVPVVTSGAGSTPLIGAPPVPARVAASSGYWMVASSGTVFAFGGAPFLGEPVGKLGRNRAVDLEPSPSRRGYWVTDDRGRVYPFGDAANLGGVTATALLPGESVTSLSATPDGGGYWVFTTRGRVFAFGNAPFAGDLAGRALNGPIMDSIATPSGKGYFMVASDGGVFTFGDARFSGSMGAVRLRGAVRSLVFDPDGSGYWLVASDGGVFAFEAPFKGSMGGQPLNRPVTGMVRFGDGYLMVGEDGGIFNFSGLPFLGSLGVNPPPAPIAAVAALNSEP